MYSNERGSRFSIIDLVVKIIFFILFVLVLLWLFPKVPNMTPFYSNVFRENISYMQDAGEAYFTTEKMPTEIGKEVKITLAEMYEKNLILPFVDEDGNSCNQYDSYVSVTKDGDSLWSLKTNLVCNNETDFVIKVLGCHNYCLNDSCAKTCHKEIITQYQYRKAITNTITSYSCPSGYTKDGSYCYKNVIKDTKTAAVTTVTNQVLTMDAKLITEEGKTLQLDVIKTKNEDTNKIIYDDVVVTVTEGTTTQVPYDCSETETKRTCTTTYKTESYSCNCTTHTVNFKDVVTCSTCTRSIPVESCSNETVTVPKTCYKTVTTEGTKKYSCPSKSTESSGSGTSLKCWHTEKVDNGYSYSCPLEATNFTGSGETLKCYKVTSAKKYYVCTDTSYTLDGKVCKKTIVGTSTEYKCDGGYVLEGTVCNKYETIKEKANSSTSQNTSYKYTWSDKTSLSGWTKTGKTRTVEGEEVCE